MEEWVTVKHFNKNEASSNGNIRNSKTGRILKNKKNHNGNDICTLRDNHSIQRSVRVHRIIADSFYDGEHDGLDVNHIDGNKSNNNISNLEFCTRKENIAHSLRNGLSRTNDYGKRRIKVHVLENDTIYNSINECGRCLGIDPSLISQYLRGEIKNCYGYHFEAVY